jgi:hypothetical protein
VPFEVYNLMMKYFRCDNCYNVYVSEESKNEMRCGGGCGGHLISLSPDEVSKYLEERWQELRKTKEQVKIRRYS